MRATEQPVRMGFPALVRAAAVALGCAAVCAGAWAQTVAAPAVAVAATDANTSPPAPLAQGTATERGFGIFQLHCVACHGNPAYERAPSPAALREFSPERIYDALTSGIMLSVGASLSDTERRLVAESLSGRLLGSTAQLSARDMPNQCASHAPLADPAAAPAWNGWGVDWSNSRYQPAAAARLSAAQVPALKLKWAFGLPNSTSAYGQPTVVSGRVFFGTDTGYVFSLDAKSGCVHWSFMAKAGVRNAMNVGPINGAGRTRYAVFFGDVKANVYALDANSGALLWSMHAEPHYADRVTAAPALYRGRLFVPISSWEEYAARSLDYPCCTSVGSVVALDANTGRRLWQTYVISPRPAPTIMNSKGVQQYAPAGGSVWNTPTIDAQRGALYIGTGDATTYPAAKTSDAVMALDMHNGKVLWSVQAYHDDSFLVACVGANRTENCPHIQGPDWDIPSSPILAQLRARQRLLLVGTKPGDVLALDPDRKGALIWRRNVNGTLAPAGGYAAGPTPGVLWGGAFDGEKLYYGLTAGGGAAAMHADTGNLAWHVPLNAVAANSSTAGAAKISYGAATSAIAGVAFVGGSDGSLIALSTQDGSTLWQFDTRREFDTVNQVPAHGGAIGSAGATIADGMVFVGSGYSVLGGQPGNVLLAFGLP
jgi:polyvinyl alcohol dehydrogenase (cytochrome)